jgi:hypothetical protein
MRKIDYIILIAGTILWTVAQSLFNISTGLFWAAETMFITIYLYLFAKRKE